MLKNYLLFRFICCNIFLFHSLLCNAQIGSLIWEDNFNTLNTQIWNPINGNGCEIGLCGWGNAELEYYTPDNLSIEPVEGETGNYALVFTAREEVVGDNYFTSGKIDSEGKLSVQYGMIEIRMMVPDLDAGLWPAAWLLGTKNISWPGKGEIDMMEMGHGEDDRAFQGYPSENINSYVGANAIFANDDGSVGMIAYDTGYNQPYVAEQPMNDRFVKYRLYWDSSSMRFTIIDNEVEYNLYTSPLPLSSNSVTGVFQEPFYFLINMAVGGNFTDAASRNEVTASLPAKMYVDYLRIYEWNGQGSVEFEYDTLEEESGIYGIYTENAYVDDELTIGSDSDIYVWNNLETGNVSPNEGVDVLSWETITAENWFGAGIATYYGKNMLNYVENGYLNFDIKIPADVNFKIGITDNYTNEKFIDFPAGETKYGLVRDGEWGTVKIPILDFASGSKLAFQDVNNMFSIASIDGFLPTQNFEFAIDNVYWTESAEDTLSNNDDFYDYSTKSSGIYPIPAKDFLNVVLPNVEKLTVIQIIDLVGNVVKNDATIGNETVELDISDLSAGVYMVKLFNENKNTQMHKLIKS